VSITKLRKGFLVAYVSSFVLVGLCSLYYSGSSSWTFFSSFSVTVTRESGY
jgi:hypothetical protein